MKKKLKNKIYFYIFNLFKKNDIIENINNIFIYFKRLN
jgi:hypothetical protein